ncbi:hypothetical protein D3C73_809270 [compost metagenome]
MSCNNAGPRGPAVWLLRLSTTGAPVAWVRCLSFIRATSQGTTERMIGKCPALDYVKTANCAPRSAGDDLACGRQKTKFPCVSFVPYCVAVFYCLFLAVWSSLNALAQILARRAAGPGARVSVPGRSPGPGTGGSADRRRRTGQRRAVDRRRQGPAGGSARRHQRGGHASHLAGSRGQQPGCAGLSTGGLRTIGGQ